MAKFAIIEKVTEVRFVEAATAQDAINAYLCNGEHIEEEMEISVDERWVEDEDGDYCEVEDS